MKGTCTLIAAAVAASTAALSSASANSGAPTFTPNQGAVQKGKSMNSSERAPKFDGLRFIETLVTAHR